MTTADSNWEDYESNFLFPPLDGPQCTCAHDATSHGYSNCEITGCNCPAYWEHA